MPLYEFRCRICGNTFEELVRNSADEAGAACPVCGDKDVQRLLSASALGFVSAAGAGGSAGGSSSGGCGGGHGGFT
ncbi:MAG: zinc ribbon domain-containing protein [Deltaproteobacteria bacterium]|nr:zinc ribbon domain-containing protein [Deltaproteobacteria bacterium]